MSPSKPGPKSRKDKTGEDWVMFKCNLTPLHHRFIMSRNMPAAQYVRLLIEMAMIYNEVPETLDKYDVDAEYVREVLAISESFLTQVRKKIVELN